MNCHDCIYYVRLRQLTSEEAKAVHKGILIDVRGCCLGVCRFERRGEKRMRLIDKDALMKTLGIKEDCEECEYANGYFCSKGSDFVNACEAICDAPIIVEFD